MENRWMPVVRYTELANGIVLDTGNGYRVIRYKDNNKTWIAKIELNCLEQVCEFLNGGETQPIS